MNLAEKKRRQFLFQLLVIVVTYAFFEVEIVLGVNGEQQRIVRVTCSNINFRISCDDAEFVFPFCRTTDRSEENK